MINGQSKTESKSEGDVGVSCPLTNPVSKLRWKTYTSSVLRVGQSGMYTVHLPVSKGSSECEGHLKMGSRGQQHRERVYLLAKAIAGSWEVLGADVLGPCWGSCGCDAESGHRLLVTAVPCEPRRVTL